MVHVHHNVTSTIRITRIRDTDRRLDLRPNGSEKAFALLASEKRATAETSWCTTRKQIFSIRSAQSFFPEFDDSRRKLMTAPAVEARHWRWHWSRGHVVAPPGAYGFTPTDLRPGRPSRDRVQPADMIPPNWQLQPADPNWHGRRFLSPGGSSWLSVYSFPVTKESIAALGHNRSAEAGDPALSVVCTFACSPMCV
jgi:hypothetical protein